MIFFLSLARTQFLSIQQKIIREHLTKSHSRAQLARNVESECGA